MSLRRSMTHHALVLGCIAAAIAAVVALTRLGTDERIDANRTQAEQRVLRALLPPQLQNAELRTIEIADEALLGLRGARYAYSAGGETDRVVILPAVARDGYSGDIQLLVAIGADGRIAGVEVVAHRETPGLGDKIERSRTDWLLQFRGRAIGDPPRPDWTVKKDGGEFDQFTGATITPRAVTHAVRRTLDYFEEHRRQLLGTATMEQNHP